MSAYILRRLLIIIPMLLAISVMTFGFINLAPGDAASAMIDPELMQGGTNDALRERMGLNKPVYVRYGLWLREIVTGNFGYSLTNGEPVLGIIGKRIVPTLELTATALLISTVFGILFGVIAAVKQYSIFDYALTFFALFGISIPNFFFALLMLYIFVALLGWFPAFGWLTYGEGWSFWDNVWHLVLPAGVLSIESMAGKTRYSRTALLEVLKADYVTTARAKGLSHQMVLWRHAFRNALLPMITITTLTLPGLFGGALIIEFMFSWPGMGQVGILAVRMRDYSVLMGLTLISTSLVLFANLLADILYAYADPRIRVR